MFGFFKRNEWVSIPVAYWYQARSYRMCKKTGLLQKTRLSGGGWKDVDGKPVFRKHGQEWVMVRIDYRRSLT